MKHWEGIALACGLLVAGVVGCGQSSNTDVAQNPTSPGPTPQVGHSSASSNAQPKSTPANSSRDVGFSAQRIEPENSSSLPQLTSNSPPDAVISAFLEATRRGDDELAASLLSQKALEETTKIGLAVKPPGTPSMAYHISEVEFPEAVPDGAYVHSMWTEQFEGVEEQYDITWVLRRQEEGWRIVGMAADLAPGEPTYFLNFEEPSELYRQMQELAGDSKEESLPQDDSGGQRTASSPAESSPRAGTDSFDLR
jgi:hypothetical protein